jgi:divalent metal cation (Fe/Co/Zn/Cd) transporter
MGFGLDAGLDAAASVALVWRFAVEAREPERADQVERAARWIVGIVLLGIAGYLVLGAVSAVFRGSRPEPTPIGFALLALSVLVLPPLALAKYRVASQIESRALRADSLLTAVAGLLAAISLISLGLSSELGVSWADPLGALIVAIFLVREGSSSARPDRR